MDEIRAIRLDVQSDPETGVVAQSQMVRVQARLLRLRASRARANAIHARAEARATRLRGGAPRWFARSFEE